MVALAVAEPPGPVQVILRFLVAPIMPVTILPDTGLEPDIYAVPLPTHEVAFVEDQLIVIKLDEVITAGSAVRVTVGATGADMHDWVKTGVAVPPEHPDGRLLTTVLVWVPFTQAGQAE